MTNHLTTDLFPAGWVICEDDDPRDNTYWNKVCNPDGDHVATIFQANDGDDDGAMIHIRGVTDAATLAVLSRVLSTVQVRMDEEEKGGTLSGSV